MPKKSAIQVLAGNQFSVCHIRPGFQLKETSDGPAVSLQHRFHRPCPLSHAPRTSPELPLPSTVLARSHLWSNGGGGSGMQEAVTLLIRECIYSRRRSGIHAWRTSDTIPWPTKLMGDITQEQTLRSCCSSG